MSSPVPIPPSAGLDVIVFGGTFDPPHLAHTELPARARGAIERVTGGEAWLLFVPAARSPHKHEGPVASDDERLAMLRLATAGLERCAVWRTELERRGPSFTIDTLRLLVGERPDLRPRLLIGADQATAFHRWRDARDAIALAPPLVMLRAPCPTREALEDALRNTGAWTPDELVAWGERVVEVGTVDVNATALRADLAALHAGRASAQQRDALTHALHPDVLAYIEVRGLYT